MTLINLAYISTWRLNCLRRQVTAGDLSIPLAPLIVSQREDRKMATRVKGSFSTEYGKPEYLCSFFGGSGGGDILRPWWHCNCSEWIKECSSRCIISAKTHSSQHHLHSRFLKSSHISVTMATLLTVSLLFFLPLPFFFLFWSTPFTLLSFIADSKYDGEEPRAHSYCERAQLWAPRKRLPGGQFAKWQFTTRRGLTVMFKCTLKRIPVLFF